MSYVSLPLDDQKEQHACVYYSVAFIEQTVVLTQRQRIGENVTFKTRRFPAKFKGERTYYITKIDGKQVIKIKSIVWRNLVRL